MANTTIPEEVLILRYFEGASEERAQLLYDILTEKMRQRGMAGHAAEVTSPSVPRTQRKQGAPTAERDQPEQGKGTFTTQPLSRQPAPDK